MVNIFENTENEEEFRQLIFTNPSSANRAFMTFLKQLFKNEDNDLVNESLNRLYGFIENISVEKKSQDFVCYCLDLVMGHSKIRESLLMRSNLEYRQALLRLFCLLCELHVEIVQFKENIIDFILSCYDASLSIEDQRLLKLIYIFESNSINLQKYQPFIWGMNGTNFYAQKHSQKLAFLIKPKMEEIFKDFIDSRFYNSLNAFPIDLKYQTNKIKIVKDDNLNRPGGYYDPRFLLPMFFHLLSSESVAKCHLFIKNGCLAYTLASLSSHSKQLRLISYNVLSRLHSHLEFINYPEDRQLWIGLIDFIRSNMNEDCQRLPSIQTVMLVKLVQIFLNPNSSLFKSAKHFILEQQERNYNFQYMPSLFNYCLNNAKVTTIEEHHVNTKFCLDWILIGLRTNEDIDVCRSILFDNLLLMFTSGMASQENQEMILQILIKLATFRKGAWLLATKLNICLWIKNQLLIQVQVRKDASISRSSIQKLILTILDTYLLYKVEVKEGTVLDEFKYYPSFEFDIVDVFLKAIHSTNKIDDLKKFVQNISNLLQHVKCDTEHSDCFEVYSILHANIPKNIVKLVEQFSQDS